MTIVRRYRKTMNVSLTPELEKLVIDKVNSGRYNSASEVVRDGLRSLQNDDLRREIMLGVEQIRAGEGIVVDGQDELRQLFEGVKRRGRQQLAQKNG